MTTHLNRRGFCLGAGAAALSACHVASGSSTHPSPRRASPHNSTATVPSVKPQRTGTYLAARPGPVLALHGGAGTIARTLDKDVRHAYAQGLREALAAGAALLDRGESALAAVEAAVLLLEDNPLFNAGKGAVYNASGEHELDAAIMDGHTLQCGAVCGVKSVAHPITLARLVMQRTPHVLLAGSGAEQFARAQGIPAVDSSYFDTPARREAWEKARLIAQNFGMPRDRTSTYGTVGAVARDHRGHLAAATSTGGMTNKAFGRVGDAPIIGAGTYADDCTCAVSCTGTGEEFIRHAAAHELGARIRLAGQSLQDAANSVIFDILKPEDGGLIALGRDGSLALPYSSLGMYRAWIDLKGQAQVAIWDELES